MISTQDGAKSETLSHLHIRALFIYLCVPNFSIMGLFGIKVLWGLVGSPEETFSMFLLLFKKFMSSDVYHAGSQEQAVLPHFWFSVGNFCVE